MTAATQISTLINSANLRPFNIQRDLLAVADLIELCFAERLDDDGRRYVNQMRAAARNAKLLGWAANAAQRISISFSGYVWEEAGRMIGNLSLIPVSVVNRRAFLIANVAVHPDYRQRGIARALTDRALDHIQRRKIKHCWLQVDDDNEAARALYEGAGFVEQARRTTWHSNPNLTQKPLVGHPGVKVVSRRYDDWALQLDWLNRLYPPKVRWHLPLNVNILRAGMGGTLSRMFTERKFQQWAARRGTELIGVLTWQSSYNQADHLWLACSAENQDDAILALLPHSRSERAAKRTLSLNFQAGRAIAAITGAGFHNHQTLIWMKRDL